MRVVGLQELCQQAGVVLFSELDPDSHDPRGLMRRDEPLRCDRYEDPATNREMVEWYGGVYCDFFYRELMPDGEMDTFDESDPRGQTYRRPGISGRWGNLQPDELFILYEEEDLKVIRQLVNADAEEADQEAARERDGQPHDADEAGP